MGNKISKTCSEGYSNCINLPLMQNLKCSKCCQNSLSLTSENLTKNNEEFSMKYIDETGKSLIPQSNVLITNN